MTPPSGLFLGIDTGGTFTDGVLLEPAARKVIRTAKVLTTHADLSLCIAQVLDKLAVEDPGAISLVSLSTTLATNAIAEGKRRPVALLLLGYDPDLVHQYGFHQQFGTPHYFFIQGKHGLDGLEQVPLDEAGIIKTVEALNGSVEAFAIASYAGSRNATHEERAGEIIASLTGASIVQAHHLSSQLDSIRRATTASLNASLLSNTQAFLSAVQEMLAQRKIHCPVMMVRGDGSIVKADYARRRPVEIIHSGPATSAVGGMFLAGVDRALVVDMGGTTTDIALIEHGSVPVEVNAATVGPYRTCVKTIKVRSFGLGGDSLIRFDHTQDITVGPERALPFSHFGAQYPQAKQVLIDWLQEKQQIYYSDRVEFWVLRREPRRAYTDARTQKAIELLKTGPQLLPKLLKQVGAVSPVQIHGDDLINQEVIERVGLTPTDLLHITGEFAPWDVETARVVIETVAKSWGISSEDFIQRARSIMTRKIAAEVIQFLSGKSLSEPTGCGIRDGHLDRWLFEESLEGTDPHLGCQIVLKDPLVGIGAPAQAFLTDVARALGTQIILPEHYAVANAVGTVVGNILVRQEGEVTPVVAGTVVTGYFAHAASLQQKFGTYDEALAFARRHLMELVAAEATNAGGGDPLIEYTENEVLPGMMVKLSAWAIAKPGRNGHG